MLDYDKVYFLTQRNYVAYFTANKKEAAHFCKRIGHPGFTCIYYLCDIVLYFDVDGVFGGYMEAVEVDN